MPPILIQNAIHANTEAQAVELARVTLSDRQGPGPQKVITPAGTGSRMHGMNEVYVWVRVWDGVCARLFIACSLSTY